MQSTKILGMRLDRYGQIEAIDKIIAWARQQVPRNICVSNVHQCMETVDDGQFRKVINQADMVMSDSQILTWTQAWLYGFTPFKVIRGIELMARLCSCANKEGIPVGLYGGTESTLCTLCQVLARDFPGLNIAIAICPPFRDLTSEETQGNLDKIRKSGARLLFVGIGCPKQENWMALHKKELSCTMIGVGAAFDFMTGVTKPSPPWVHPLGLEWLWRIYQEPRRLWLRYAKHNTRFVFYVLCQKLGRQYP